MPKMKHLLRKLHIGSGLNEQQRLAEAQPVISSIPSPSPSPNSNSTSVTGMETTTSSSSSWGSSGTMGRIGAVEPVVGDRTAGDEVDFSLLEEEFQMQLALAISASDPETVQIDAAKRISLAGTDTNTFFEFLSIRYWNYNVVNYNEKIVDGFYDVYGIASTLGAQGKMPSLVDLRAVSVLDNVDYQVILVNRLLDPELQELEKRVYNMYVQSRSFGRSPVVSGMIQKIAEMVVNRMGGPVADAEEMLRMWTSRSYELQNSLKTIILPLGRLDVGLSRHRALLFKVLADRINLPCMLVKGSYYTGTDDGAVNLVRINNGSEYIIDLMGAPGTLIPAEVPSCHLLNSALGVRGFTDLTEASRGSRLLLDQGIENMAVSATLDTSSKAGALRSVEFVSSQTNKDERNFPGRAVSERSEQDLGKLLPSAPKSSECVSAIHDKPSAAQKRKVKNVSKYVISAAKDPEFAQKLHAVLLESGASPPPDLFMDINSQDLGEQCMSGQVVKGTNVDVASSCHSNKLSTNELSLVSSGMETSENTNFTLRQKQMAERQRELELNAVKTNVASSSDASKEGLLVGYTTNDWIQIHEPSFSSDEFCQIQPENVLITDEKLIQRTSNLDFCKESALEGIETAGSDWHLVGNDHSEKIYPMPREVSEWEIPWEDLQIGERIGIGSYGEVYRADWNGTVEIMLRLRHPNVVLFMGAVTRSPHFSILTEFLPRGSLYKLLHRPNHQLDEKRRMRMALDVVCDFGLSRSKHHTFLSSKSTAGTPEWMAPEVLRNEPANEKCDVYSFGVILWELVTLRIPWKGLNPMQVVGAVGFQNRRLEIPEDVDPMVAQIIRECWQTRSLISWTLGATSTTIICRVDDTTATS
ncbi:Serine/threonine-protein kinase CTR1 [Gossypium arboreum]|uniref:Serine/threonine-protein kinase CTR1 n=1 Tax=Gossypium arboreum TaxID=29729 RepID=A0A0B0NL89_GOSAR|nr:Serine/threonine-protein kinase CTR1 [Gossypium arboreum]